MQSFSRKSGEQVLARRRGKGEVEQKSHATFIQCFPPFQTKLLFEWLPKSQVLWTASTRPCQPHSTPYLQNSPLIFTDAILSEPLPAVYIPSASVSFLGTSTHSILPDQQYRGPISPPCFHFMLTSEGLALWRISDENTNAQNSLSHYHPK